jgi:hypothetical protein
VRKVLYTAAILLVVGPLNATAGLVTYQIDVKLHDCEPWGLGFGCQEYFELDTGYSLNDRPWDVRALFTIDLTAVQDGSTSFLFEGPGTGMSVTIGNLTLFSPSVGIWIGDGGDMVGIGTGDLFLANFVFAHTSPEAATDMSIVEFLTSDLSVWRATGIPPYVQHPFHGWQIFTSGDTLSIKRVPEPGTLALVVVGLIGLVFARRRTTRKHQLQ